MMKVGVADDAALVRERCLVHVRRRRLVVARVLLCVFAGAVVTWAVAWGCALWGPKVIAAPSQERGFRPSLIEVPAEWLGDSVGARGEKWARSFERCFLDEWAIRGVSCEDCSWPARAMRSVSIWRCDFTEGDGQVTSDYLDAPKMLAASGNSTLMVMAGGQLVFKSEIVPTRVLPLGFVVNTCLAAGAGCPECGVGGDERMRESERAEASPGAQFRVLGASKGSAVTEISEAV